MFSRTDMYKKMRDYVSGRPAGSSGANARGRAVLTWRKAVRVSFLKRRLRPMMRRARMEASWEPADGSKIQHIRGPVRDAAADHEERPPILPKRHAFCSVQLYS